MYAVKRIGLKLTPLVAATITQLFLLFCLAKAESQPLTTGQVSGSALALSFSYSARKVEPVSEFIDKTSNVEKVVLEKNISEKGVAEKNIIEKDVIEKVISEKKVIEKTLLERIEPDSPNPVMETENLITDTLADINHAEVKRAADETRLYDASETTKEFVMSEPLAEPRKEEHEVDPLLDALQEQEFIGELAGVNADMTGAHQDIELEPAFYSPPEPPSYPRIARKRGQEGVVWLDIWLDHKGSQVRLEVFDSSGVQVLDQAAIDAVSRWSFIPKQVAGLAMASRVRVPVHFELN